MSRLKAVRPSARSPDSKTAGIADVVGETLHRSHELGVEGKPSKPGVPDELAEKVRQVRAGVGSTNTEETMRNRLPTLVLDISRAAMISSAIRFDVGCFSLGIFQALSE